MPLLGVAAAFIESQEFERIYGSNDNMSDFIVGLYQNALGRAPDQAGFAYWMNQVQTGQQDQASLLLNFSESAENISNTTADIELGVAYLPWTA